MTNVDDERAWREAHPSLLTRMFNWLRENPPRPRTGLDKCENGPRLLSPKLMRNDYFEHRYYTLRLADAIDVYLTDRQARDLYQQLHEEFKPKATIVTHEKEKRPHA